MKHLPPGINTALSSGGESWLIFAAIILPGIVAFIWVAFFRPKRRRRKHRHHHSRTQGVMNPTLEQTGGLPPVRTPETSPDQPKS